MIQESKYYVNLVKEKRNNYNKNI